MSYRSHSMQLFCWIHPVADPGTEYDWSQNAFKWKRDAGGDEKSNLRAELHEYTALEATRRVKVSIQFYMMQQNSHQWKILNKLM